VLGHPVSRGAAADVYPAAGVTGGIGLRAWLQRLSEAPSLDLERGIGLIIALRFLRWLLQALSGRFPQWRGFKGIILEAH